MAAGSALLLALLTGGALALAHFWPALDAWRMAPRVAFRPLPALPADAYAARAMWLSRPGLIPDPARYLPAGMPGEARGKAYVFFVHPTTFMGRNRWNGAIDHGDSRMRATLSARTMASVFNAEAGVYAPYYRQASFGTFLTDGASSQAALAIAEGDVRAGFAAFLHAIPPGAPIVLAGHGQGALILLHILRDQVRGSPVARRVVVAYLAGWPISPRHDLLPSGLPACRTLVQTGCMMGWISFAPSADARQIIAMARRYPPLDGAAPDAAPMLCTNPLTGGARGDAPAAANLGSLATGDEHRAPALVLPSVAARCDARSGLLLVSSPPHLGDQVMPGNNYTMYDFALFWRNLRADVARRDAAWTAAPQ